MNKRVIIELRVVGLLTSQGFKDVIFEPQYVEMGRVTETRRHMSRFIDCPIQCDEKRKVKSFEIKPHPFMYDHEIFIQNSVANLKQILEIHINI